MPRDIFSNYTLPAGNPVVTGTIISTTWANTTLNDIATALTQSLSTDGSTATVSLANKTMTGGTYSTATLVNPTLSGTMTGGTHTSASITSSTWTGGTFAGTITNSGTIQGGTISSAVHSGGTITGAWANSGTITGGNYATASISGSTLTTSTFSGGTITGAITNSGTVTGGTYAGSTHSGTTTNSGTITGGTISSAAVNTVTVTSSTWTGGTINGSVTNSATITGGTYSGPTVTGILTLTGGQIAFPATQVPSAGANTLDDYEEGSWTPTYTCGAPGNLSVVYNSRGGTYTKIGRIVTFSMILTTTSFAHTTASGDIIITGLPFTISTAWRASVTLGNFTVNTAADGVVTAMVTATTIRFSYSATSNGTTTIIQVANNPSGVNIEYQISGFYEAT